MSEGDEHDEILRLRDRMHEILNDLAALRFHVEDLREWRTETRLLFERLREDMDGVLKSDEIADAVANKVNATNTLRLSFVQKSAAMLVAVASFAAAVKVLIGA